MGSEMCIRDRQGNGTSIKREDQYMTDVHGDEAVRYIEQLRDPNKPFFLYVPFLAPHSPMQAPEELEDKYSKRRNRPFPKRTYAAMVDSLDQAVGKVLESLETQGLAENTLVFFFSDNGGLKAFGADNSPYRGGKLETFEGGIRVNAIMRWPEKSRREQRVRMSCLFSMFFRLSRMPQAYPWRMIKNWMVKTAGRR